MRPVERGASPIAGDYRDHRDAFGALTNRLGGLYCSYCERRIPTNLAVEHIQPKAPHRYPHLAGRWDNFLLACVNCNSTKKEKDVTLADEALPDRDNTFAAYQYRADGTIHPATTLSPSQRLLAERTLSLVGLDKDVSAVYDENDQLVVADRKAQRLEVRLIAKRALSRLQVRRTPEMVDQIVETALGQGHFSTWMDVFEAEAAVRSELIVQFSAARACFDPSTTLPVTPRPPNGLPHAGKI